MNRWTPLGSITAARSGACAAVLAKGGVMLAGGSSAAGPVSTVELYSDTGAVSGAASLPQASANPACTAMPDGRVSVEGQVYDPATGAWTPAPGVPTRRAGDAVAALSDGRLVLAGGFEHGRASRAVTAFDPSTNSVKSMGTLLTARSHAVATPLPDGTVLITGGNGESGAALASAEIFDPATGISRKTGNLVTARADHAAVLLTDNGQVLIAGGRNRAGALAESELYTPATGTFAPAAAIARARYGATAMIPRSGTAILTGGQDGSGVISAGESFGYATLRSDKQYYGQNDAAAISGEGWLAGAQVQVNMLAKDGTPVFQTTVTADAAGRIQTAVPPGRLSGGPVTVQASDGVSQAFRPLIPAGTIPIVSANLTGQSVVVGSPANFNVIILGVAGHAAPTGFVVFSAGGQSTPLTSLLPTNPSCTSSCTSIAPGSLTLPAGTYTVEVDYNGDGTYASSAPATTLPGFVVSPGTTSVGVTTSAPGGVQAGQSVTFTATLSQVTGSTGFAGTISWLADGGAIASCPAQSVTAAGQYTCTTTALPVSVAAHAITATFTPTNNNYTGNSGSVTQTVLPYASTVNVTSASPNPSYYGQAVTFTVTVHGAGAMTPTGTVSLLINGIPLSFTTALSGSGSTATANITVQATPTNPGPLVAGNNSLGVTYSGDSNYAGSNGGGAVEIVSPLSTTTTISPTSVSAVYGQNLTFTAQVAVNAPASFPLPNGNITFQDGGAALPGGVYGQATSANYVTNSLSVGTHRLTATYSPSNTNFTGSASNTSTVTVSKATTMTALASTAQYTLVATVTVAAPGGGIPTGSVGLQRNGLWMAYSQLTPVAATGNQFTATFQLTPGQLGGYTAIYAGDSNFVGSTSNVVYVNGPVYGPANVTLTAMPNPVSVGQPITFNANVTPTFGGLAQPTGNVQFMDGSKALGLVALDSGLAVFTATNLTAGNHTITAIYSGDQVYATAQATYGIQVQWMRSSVSVAAAATPVYGQPATFNVTLTGTVSGLPNPTGKIQLLDSGTVIGTANAGGMVQIAVKGLTAGVHQITAVYSGDADWAGATSAPLAQTVTQAASATSLNAVPSLQPNQITLTATVSSTAGVPTGSISFVDGTSNAVLATATLAHGTAVATIPTGNNSIVALYSGDSNFLASSSNGFVEATVGNAASYATGTFAPGEIVTIKGTSLAQTTLAGTFPLQTVLGGVSVAVTDNRGQTQFAQIYYVSPVQVNFVMPSSLAAGPATVSIENNLSVLFSLSITVATDAPGLFTADASGKGALVGVIVDVAANGQSTATPMTGSITMKSGDMYYLELFGTGLDNAKVSTVTATVNGVAVPVLFAGPQPQYPGLDQVNLGPLPASLAGSGTVPVVITVNGQSSSPVTVTIQ